MHIYRVAARAALLQGPALLNRAPQDTLVGHRSPPPPMYPQRGVRVPRDPRRTDFFGTGFAAVISAVSFLLLRTVGGDEAVVPGSDQWQVILAFALLAAGLLTIMHGMRLRDARPPAFVRRVVDAAAAVLWNAGGPERLLPLVILLLCPFLEAWFDFI